MGSPASFTNQQIAVCERLLEQIKLPETRLHIDVIKDLFCQQVLRVLDALVLEVASKYAVSINANCIGYQSKLVQLQQFNSDMAEVKRFEHLVENESWFLQIIERLTSQQVALNAIVINQADKEWVIVQQLKQFVVQIRQLSQYE